MMRIILGCLVFFGVSVAVATPRSFEMGKENYVQQLFTDKEGQTVAILRLKNKNLVQQGMLLKAYRWATPKRHDQAVRIPTGEVKVIKVDHETIIGAVIADGSALSQRLFKHPGIMAGDELTAKQIDIITKAHISPRRSVGYDKLFANPTRYDKSFELSAQGEKELTKIADIFGHLRTQQLVIEAHTDAAGSAADNQVESLQRAMAIKHQLVTQFGFDQDRILALGFGDSEPVNEVYYPGVERLNRRIVFRVSNE